MADENNENATTADKITANSVTTAKLTADAVTADKLTVDSVQAGNITALAGTAGKDDSDVSASGVLDLRPPSASLKAELCRLGLEYSSTDAAGVESWRDYQRGVLATFDGTGANVTIADVKTNLSATLSLAEVRKVTRIDTMTTAD
ncbi:hypothetical protein [Bifidobacterium catenulatum]|uniref:Uncharacterized protein n=1 Tax=Bifidobacterium catenulatum PV20-2 TaxID=1447716 RepID=A0A0A7I2P5_9BIFI|nr:hypothetical protein [Bifidobacterium catenulatum]AIZ14538.1 hypothetical protein AH68_05210 [Bifidobacterium catenulatum PV20-2]